MDKRSLLISLLYGDVSEMLTKIDLCCWALLEAYQISSQLETLLKFAQAHGHQDSAIVSKVEGIQQFIATLQNLRPDFREVCNHMLEERKMHCKTTVPESPKEAEVVENMLSYLQGLEPL